ncbi:diacylglycerol kinase beta-like isoform X2 [Clytia hemisphaerica]|uniref:Diacylglycerol kinase n=1 Tax=Clytia hemisphaerica TaxID=252671 RepID=A0A7M5V068_9CNID|eukprot:TCONS_00066683-protein
MAAAGIWDRLHPDEFTKLQEYTKYSKRRLKDVLQEFREGYHEGYDPEQPMGYDGFKLFMSVYLGQSVSEELMQTLFWTFHKKVPRGDAKSPDLPNTILRKILVENGNVSQESLDQLNESSLSRIAKGARRATVVATATVVAGDIPRRAISEAELSRIDKTNDEMLTPITKRRLFLDTMTHLPMIEIKEIACYLSLLEGGDVKDKLEFVFRVYDSDNNDYLDGEELESIVSQMLRVAEYLGWDTTALKPILTDMLADMDYDSDGQISLEEWVKGGMNNIPFLVLMGMEIKVDEEGKHQWAMKHFKTQAFCNICHGVLAGFGRKQGLQCIFCRFTCHERCVQRSPNSCISTYTQNKTKRKVTEMDHHWVEGNCPGKCTKCNKTIKNNCLTGLHCVWCSAQVHNRCVTNMPVMCSLGPHKVHILPPICITPASKEKAEKVVKDKKNSVISYDGIPMQITPLPDTKPLIAFINPKSGGRQGARLLNKFRYLLNPRQVFNLAEGGPFPGLKFFAQVPDFRVLCCGGDGTAGWILATIDRLTSLKQRPPMAILPLGTGNDLARCLGWGGGYEGGSLDKVLQKVLKSSVVMMDRWQIDCDNFEKTSIEGDIMPQNIMNNYFSIGVDAAIALKFHLQREKNPEKFNSRFKNKLRYFQAGTSEQLAATCTKLSNFLEIICDGKKLELPSLEGIAILNIPSIYGGANIWGEPEKKRKRRKKSSGSSGDEPESLGSVSQDISDRKLEVVGLENSLYVGQIIAGVRQHGLRLAQCSTVVIKIMKTMPMQIDGEPWMQAPAQITINHKNQSPMCVAPRNEKRGWFRF